MLTREQALAREVPTAMFQESQTSRYRQFAIFGMAPGFRWYHRFSHLHSSALTRITLGPPSHRTQCGELWISCSIPQQLSHFKTITRITSLTLNRIAVMLFDFPALQRTFRDLASTITNLRLLYPSGSPGSLLQFIMIFRNLQVTTVHAPSWVKQNKDTHTVHFGQLHGTLCLSEFNDRSNPFLSLLELHAAGIKKVTISECNFHDLRPLQRLLSSAGRNIQDLQLIVGGNGEHGQLSSAYHF